jgi:FkbM family methyltransferase
MIPRAFKRFVKRALPRSARDVVSVWYWRMRNAAAGSYEPECEQLGRFVKEGDWVVDVGVNMGQYSARLGRLVGRSGKVIGFEASRATFRQTQKIVGSPTVNVHNLAVGAAEGEVTLARYADQFGVTNHGISRVTTANDQSASERETVRCVSLDEFLSDRAKPISFLKCDVEGYEPQVFDGAAGLIAKDKPVILVEIQDPQNYRHVASMLEPLGYEAYQLDKSVQWKSVGGYDERWTINFLFSPAGRGV